MSLLPTLLTHTQVALEHSSFHVYTASGGLWHLSPLRVLEYCKFNTNLLSTELSTIFKLDSSPKASTVLKTICLPDFRVAPGARHGVMGWAEGWF